MPRLRCGAVSYGQEFPEVPRRTAVMTVGHIIRVSRAGQNVDGNLRTECQRCGDESRDIAVDPPTGQQVFTHASCGSLRDKRTLYGWMQAGRRTPSDTEKVFRKWSRLPHFERMHVMTALAGQVIRELESE
ncbi:hypothetical protein ACFYWN_43670 [Streptomyces sp. NPDC002917]|uniref:hypothetical protein n=1 Tax=Streptomyces sp. NPDC002917 TaxID=3364671 RepID=UPI00367FA367